MTPSTTTGRRAAKTADGEGEAYWFYGDRAGRPLVRLVRLAWRSCIKRDLLRATRAEFHIAAL